LPQDFVLWSGMYCIIRTKNQNTLFSLGMLTYTDERQDIIQIALKGLPGGGRGECRKKKIYNKELATFLFSFRNWLKIVWN
jgi:hypothetical protein